MIDRDKVKLLLIDDHELTRSILRQIVHEAGYTQLREAADGETGLTLAKHFAPHLICLDNQMPGNSGLVVLGELKTALPSTKVVMITSSNDKATVVACLRAGASGYVLKPFKTESPLKLLDELLAKPAPAAPNTASVPEAGSKPA